MLRPRHRAAEGQPSKRVDLCRACMFSFGPAVCIGIGNIGIQSFREPSAALGNTTFACKTWHALRCALVSERFDGMCTGMQHAGVQCGGMDEPGDD